MALPFLGVVARNWCSAFLDQTNEQQEDFEGGILTIVGLKAPKQVRFSKDYNNDGDEMRSACNRLVESHETTKLNLAMSLSTLQDELRFTSTQSYNTSAMSRKRSPRTMNFVPTG
ncbi:unnamed protein product [Dracunculus medinensis]|uniref:IMD domain-containing protein n=1 Tax=Dracunculus medinensis TaxID=318479 RepID=A0A0N4UCK4_DRAME|nr:unnamed protein product [Dracunculus medinensis]